MRAVWQVCSDDARYEAGLNHDSFSANGETSRTKLAREFLESVDGLKYLSPANKALEIDIVISNKNETFL